jgi:hypothetical protein
MPPLSRIEGHRPAHPRFLTYRFGKGRAPGRDSGSELGDFLAGQPHESRLL